MSETPAADSLPNTAPSLWASCFTQWGWRLKAPAAVLALYTVLATAVMAPLASPCLPESPSEDAANHVSGIIEARNALAEGQFPVRVAPHQNDGTRYPIFQFYGNLPYTAAALLCLAARANPYHAWKLIVTVALVLGAFFTYAAARLLTRQGLPAAAAGAVFLTAPYLLTDIHGRFAYPEIISFCLLPLLFWSLLRSFSSPELSRILVSGVAWAALALSHNITYVYASTLFALFFLSYFRLTWKYVRRMCGLAAGFALGLLLTAWYVAPQLALLPSLGVSGTSTVWGWSWLTPLGVLLAPTMTHATLQHTTWTHFGLQVGWPILAAIGTTLYALADAQVPSRWRRATMTRLLLAFGLAFLLVWSPFNFWRYLPGLFHFVQFSYRLLMFVVLWGALLAGQAVALLFKDKMTGPQLAACVAVLGALAAPCLGPHTACQSTSVEQEMAHPDMGRGGANDLYNLKPAVLAEKPPHGQREDVLLLATPAGRPATWWVHADEPALVRAPVLYYPRMLRVTIDGHTVPYGNLGRFVAVAVGPGDHVIAARFVGLPWANALSLATWVAVLAGLALPTAWRLGRPAAAFVDGWFVLLRGRWSGKHGRVAGNRAAVTPDAPPAQESEAA
jgi:hypothetical protein